MFRTRWAGLALSAGLLITSTGCFFNRCGVVPNHSECECMDMHGGTPYGVTGMEGPVMAPPTFPGMPPMSSPPPTMGPPPRIVPIPANPTPYSPYSGTKFYRD